MLGDLQSQTSSSTSRSLLQRSREHDSEAWEKLTAIQPLASGKIYGADIMQIQTIKEFPARPELF